MSNVIFITGPSGSGKTTVAAQVAEHWPTQCALLDFDKIRTFIKSGYAEPANGWNDETEKQWALARMVVTSMIHTYLANDTTVVVEVFATPHDYPDWQKTSGDTDLKVFVLLPPLKAVIARNGQRSGVAKLKEADIKQNYEWSEGWKSVEDVSVIDNSTSTPEQTAHEIIKLAF